MISCICGPLGSGKSFYACNYLFKFCSYDEMYNEYSIAANVLIISNIEGLKVKHWDLQNCLDKKEGVLKAFFSIDNFENIMKTTGKNHIILCIDEAHTLFDSKFYDKDIYEFFAYSRHIGLDIILMSQGMQSMSRMFNPLLEFVVNAKPRSKQILNNMSYRFTDLKGGYLYDKSIMKNKLVFGMYKSFRVDETNKPKNAVLHWIVITAVFLLVAGGLFKFALSSLAAKGRPENTKKLTSPTAAKIAASFPAPAPVSVPSAPVAFKPVSSSKVLAVAPFSVSAVPAVLPRVSGFVGDASGKNLKYLLSTGQIVSCKRNLSIGDVYIR